VFSLYYQNVRGLRTKLASFKDSVLLSHDDVIAISESWLTPDISSRLFCPDSYITFRSDRDAERTGFGRGGGVFISCKSTLNCRRLEHLETSSDLTDTVWVEIVCKDRSLLIGNHYFPPRCSPQDYTSYFSSLSDRLLHYSSTHDIIVLGDFNVPDLDLYSDSLTTPGPGRSEVHQSIDDLMSTCNLHQVNTCRNHQGKLLDLIFTNSDLLIPCVSSPAYVSPDLYHPPLFIDLSPLKVVTIMGDSHVKFQWNRADTDAIRRCLSSRDIWSDILAASDANIATATFTSLIINLINQYVPRATVRPGRKFPRWFSSELRRYVVLKERFRRKRSRSVNFEFAYMHYRGQVKRCLARDKAVYRKHLRYRLRHNPRAFWSSTGPIMKPTEDGFPALIGANGVPANNSRDNADILATAFSQVFNNAPIFCLGDNLDPLCTQPYATSLGISCLSIEPSNVIRAVKTIRASNHSPDGIPGFFVKNFIDLLIIPISHIFCLSVKTCTFPSLWKTATIIPIFKKGSRSDPGNYRPISLLPFLSKVFERVVYWIIVNEFRQIVSPVQHAFTPGRSTLTNLCSFMSKIVPVFENRGQVDCIYLDCTKAFDLLPHQVILQCLRTRLQCSDCVISWFGSYLANRANRVMVMSSHSRVSYTASSGVPQGSLLGPLLFCIVVNSASQFSQHSNLLQYADDSKLFRPINNANDCVLLQNDLNSVVAHLTSLGLSCNPNKTLVVRFTRRRKPIIHEYSVNNVSIPSATTVRDLGVIFDCKLHFKAHVSHVRSQCLRALGKLHRTSKELQLPFSAKKLLFHAHINSILTYCSPVWNSLSQTQLNRLTSVHKKCIYSILQIWSCDLPYSDACEVFGIFPLFQQLSCSDATLLLKLLSGITDCSDLLECINFNTRCGHYNTRALALFQPLTSSLDPLARAQRLVCRLASENPEFDIYRFSPNATRNAIKNSFSAQSDS
jgi:hypothetical protein